MVISSNPNTHDVNAKYQFWLNILQAVLLNVINPLEVDVILDTNVHSYILRIITYSETYATILAYQFHDDHEVADSKADH